METPLLQTKLYIPPPGLDFVPRLRLLERLNQGLQGPLTLITAPAGFGKTTLTQALTMAEPENFIRIFVDEGPPLAALLKKIKSDEAGGILPVQEYIDKLLAAFEAEGQETGRSPLLPRAPVPLFVDPLSERELEVLRLVASGASNQNIADKLFITLGTVKNHLSNILGKLGVGNRRQATLKAEELGLI